MVRDVLPDFHRGVHGASIELYVEAFGDSMGFKVTEVQSFRFLLFLGCAMRASMVYGRHRMHCSGALVGVKQSPIHGVNNVGMLPSTSWVMQDLSHQQYVLGTGVLRRACPEACGRQDAPGE